jgi:hypothetical protein
MVSYSGLRFSGQHGFLCVCETGLPRKRDKCVNEIIFCAPILGISTLTKLF